MIRVAVARDDDKFRALEWVLDNSDFDSILETSYQQSKKSSRDAFSIAIKPNMMVFSNLAESTAVTTDVELVEHLIKRIRDRGFTNLKLVESQNVMALWVKGHLVKRVAALSGYSGNGYEVIDLTEETMGCEYRWRDGRGVERKWKHKVGRSWFDADFRISFAKYKSHESDYFTLSVKNVYGCFPLRDKQQQYHILREVPDVTAASMWTFPVHFAIVDGFIASDGYQGYKTQKNPKLLKMMFAGSDAVAVDMECAKRGGIDPRRMHILAKTVEFAYGGDYPDYKVVGDLGTMVKDVCPEWQNISDETVDAQDFTEESLFISGLMNVNAVDYIDFKIFPPRNVFWRFTLVVMRLVNKLRKFVNRLAGKRIW